MTVRRWEWPFSAPHLTEGLRPYAEQEEIHESVRINSSAFTAVPRAEVEKNTGAVIKTKQAIAHGPANIALTYSVTL
jgi:hypothetical protein